MASEEPPELPRWRSHVRRRGDAIAPDDVEPGRVHHVRPQLQGAPSFPRALEIAAADLALQLGSWNQAQGRGYPPPIFFP